MAKLTKELTQKICDLIKAGNFINAVCGHVGISEPTFYGWYNKGKEAGKGQYHEFYMAVESAKAVSEVDTLKSIIGDKDWRAKAWFLSRRFRDKWGDKPTVIEAVSEIDTDGLRAKLLARVKIEAAGEPTIDLSTLNDDQLEKYEIFLNSLNEGAVVVLPDNGRG